MALDLVQSILFPFLYCSKNPMFYKMDKPNKIMPIIARNGYKNISAFLWMISAYFKVWKIYNTDLYLVSD